MLGDDSGYGFESQGGVREVGHESKRQVLLRSLPNVMCQCPSKLCGAGILLLQIHFCVANWLYFRICNKDYQKETARLEKKKLLDSSRFLLASFLFASSFYQGKLINSSPSSSNN